MLLRKRGEEEGEMEGTDCLEGFISIIFHHD